MQIEQPFKVCGEAAREEVGLAVWGSDVERRLVGQGREDVSASVQMVRLCEGRREGDQHAGGSGRGARELAVSFWQRGCTRVHIG